MDYNFDVMLDNVPVVTVKANLKDRTAAFVKHTDDRRKLPAYLYGLYGFRATEPSFYWLEKFIEDRTFPRERMNCNDLLAWMGLDRYDVWEINRKTHGITTDDPFWLRFEGESVTREELR